MKNKFVSTLIILILFLAIGIHAQTTDLENKGEKILSNLIEKDKKHQEKILAKFTEFVNKMKSKFPQLEIKEIPVNPGFVDSVSEHEIAPTGKKKVKPISAYLLEPYYVRTTPDPRNIEWVGKVKRGEKVDILHIIEPAPGEKKSIFRWCLVKLSNNKEGFIPADLLSHDSGGKKKKAELSNSKKSVGSLQVKHIFHHLEIQVYGALLSSLDISEGDKLYVTTDSLRIRMNSGLASDEVGRAIRGDEVKVLTVDPKEDFINGIKSNWVLGEVGGIKGWMFGGYLSKNPQGDQEDKKSPVKALEEDPEELKKGEKRYVRVLSLRMRDEANENGTVISTIPGEARIEILDAKSDIDSVGGIRSKWIYIIHEGMEGWVYGGFVSKKKGELIDSDDIARMFQLPLDNEIYITSDYGIRTHPVTGKKNSSHQGIDLNGREGTPIKCVSDGKVFRVEDRGSQWLGRFTVIEHKNNIFTYYGHQSRHHAKEGDKIKAGDLIGYIGNTGNSKGAHLHFEVREGVGSGDRVEANKPLNPHDFMKIPKK